MKLPLLALTCAALMTPVASVNAQSNDTSNLVLVHGAHFTSQAWQNVQANIPNTINTFAIDLPGRQDNFSPDKVSLTLSATVLCAQLSKIKGDKTVAVHSQAGAIFNATLAICPDVSLKKVVYVSAVSPLDGEKAFKLLSQQDGDNYFNGLHFNKAESMLEISNEQSFANSFAPNANAKQKKWLKKYAVSEPSMMGEEQLELNKARFKAIKKYYVFANQDKVISLSSQKKIANRMNLVKKFNIDSGHLPMLTHPKKLASILTRVAKY